MGSCSPQRVDDVRTPLVFSQLQGGFSVADIKKYCKKQNIQNKMVIRVINGQSSAKHHKISIAAISSIAATGSNAVALINSTHLSVACTSAPRATRNSKFDK
jgi:hypothetical protein